MAKLFIEDLELHGMRVLMRVDFNVPLDKGDGHVKDDSRIKATLPSIRYVLDHGGILILMSHLGRPDGKVVPSMSLGPVAERLGTLLGKPVLQLPDCIGPEVENAVRAMKPGQVALLENLRFHPEEEANDPAFSKALASLGDLYVNDAFGTAHRAHASTVGVTRYVAKAAAGYLMRDELNYLGNLLCNPARPFTAILGGAKVSTKIGVIENLLGKADRVLIGGAMSYTFLKARGIPVGSSLVEPDLAGTAGELMREAAHLKKELLLPIDHLIAKKIEEGSETKTAGQEGIPDGWIGVDIGPVTVSLYGKAIAESKTIFWNGPMGVFEVNAFAAGTVEIAKRIAASGAVSVVGGGDSVAALNQFGLEGSVTHISTGGGASLEFIEGKELPGVQALSEK